MLEGGIPPRGCWLHASFVAEGCLVGLNYGMCSGGMPTTAA